MRRMCDLLKSTKKPGHHIRLNRRFRSDLAWWLIFVAEWNGITIMSTMVHTPPENTITSDASGGWGCGCYWSGRWFQLEWVPQWRDKSIALKELLPIVIACVIWGTNWRGEAVMARSDNMSGVAVINSRSSCDPELMHLDVGFSSKLDFLSTQGADGSVLSLPDPTPIIRPSGDQAARLDISRLDIAVQHYFELGVAQSTLKTYSAAWKKFSQFCTLHNEQSNSTPRCSRKVSAASLPWLEHFRVQWYT